MIQFLKSRKLLAVTFEPDCHSNVFKIADHPGSVLPPPVANAQFTLKNGELMVLNVIFKPDGSTVIGAPAAPVKLTASTSEPFVKIPKAR